MTNNHNLWTSNSLFLPSLHTVFAFHILSKSQNISHLLAMNSISIHSQLQSNHKVLSSPNSIHFPQQLFTNKSPLYKKIKDIDKNEMSNNKYNSPFGSLLSSWHPLSQKPNKINNQPFICDYKPFVFTFHRDLPSIHQSHLLSSSIKIISETPNRNESIIR